MGQGSRCIYLTFALIIVGAPILGHAAKNRTPSLPPRLSEPLAAAADLTTAHEVIPNVVYLTANNYEDKLDVYRSLTSEPEPTLIYFHGGGWKGGFTKEQFSLWFEPFLFLGWDVVNVEYRPSSVSLAPAAVEDCLCALRWTIRNAARFHFDTDRIVVMGHSAGGQLALMTGMVPESAGLDAECPGDEPLKVAAIVDWFGVTDVEALVDGPSPNPPAIRWLGSLPNRRERALRVSPLTYVRNGLPPIIIIHGDSDPKVPYNQALRLHASLTKAGVPNNLITIPGGGHGGFGKKQTERAYAEIFEFLREHGILMSK